MFKKIALLGALTLGSLASGLSQAAYIKLQDAPFPGSFYFFGGNTGDPYSYSATGALGSWSNASSNASSAINSTHDITLFTSGANAYTDYSMYFVYGGKLLAELDFDYLGNYNGQTGVQKITYNNFVAQNLAITAPVGGGVVSMALAVNWAGQGDHYYVPVGFDSHNEHTAFYNDGIVISAASVANLPQVAAPVPEPETYAMMLAGLGLLGAAARRRRMQQAA